MTSAISTSKFTGKEATIVTITIITKVGDVHAFPAMDLEALALVLPKGMSGIPSSATSLALVNASLCFLSIPFNIIRRIDVNKEEWWVCPV